MLGPLLVKEEHEVGRGGRRQDFRLAQMQMPGTEWSQLNMIMILGPDRVILGEL